VERYFSGELFHTKAWLFGSWFLNPFKDLKIRRCTMKSKCLIITALAMVLTFGFASSGLQAKDSISAYMG